MPIAGDTGGRRLADLRPALWLLTGLLACSGCATIKESDTSRTGIEQLLISTAADRALDKVDFKPIAGAKVFVDVQYLDCVDKNYIIVALHQRLLQNNCTLADKVEDSDIKLEISSGGVGTDRHELMVGVPQIPLPPPSPISVPKMPFFTRTKSMGTAKLTIVAMDTKTKRPVINSGYTLARADFKSVQFVGTGSYESGKVEEELVAATGQRDSLIGLPSSMAHRNSSTTAR